MKIMKNKKEHHNSKVVIITTVASKHIYELGLYGKPIYSAHIFIIIVVQ